MAKLLKGDGHVSVRPYCGLCGSSMEVSEPCFLLLGNSNSTGFSQRLGPYEFPDYGHQLRSKNGVSLCRKPTCRLCAVSPEASVAHSDCLEFFARRFKLRKYLECLWVATAWRAPWRQAPHLHLKEATIKTDRLVLSGFGIPNMKLLPAELISMIREYSPNSAIWRFQTVSSLAERLSVAGPGHLLTLPLCAVLAWKRGSQPVTTKTAELLPFIRLTIDSWGIQEVERLHKRPRLGNGRTDSFVFAILDSKWLEGVIAHFKSGSLRLELPEECEGLQIWDTPTPPDLQRCHFYPANITSFTRFRTIDLLLTDGITFFFCYGQIYAVHAHTRTTPCAQTTFQRLSCRRQQSVTWVYVPFSQQDPIVAVGSRTSASKSTCLLLRMKLGGDVSIGFSSSNEARDLLLSQVPTTIIHDTSELHPVSVIGAYPATERQDNTTTSPFKHPLIEDPPFSNACFSLASLEQVSSLTIFNSRHSSFCVGILLRYQNGAHRSLGQCRLGVDPFEECVRPVRICLRRQVHHRPRTPIQLRSNLVNSTSKQEHNHDEQGWTCYEIQGQLEFWFSPEETKLAVVVD